MWVDDLSLYNIASELLASSTVKEHRKEICSTCDHLTKLNTCDLCNCVMPAKWWLKHASCPQDMWAEQQ
jgi:hypothetical protein